jgi:membrane protease YdiL (CAAX protease family)
MVNVIRKSNEFMLRKSYGVQVLIFFALAYAVSIAISPLTYLIEKFEGVNTARHRDLNLIAAALLAPLLETLIFQYLLYKVIYRIKSKNKAVLYLHVSAILFGVSHDFNYSYIAFAIAIGYLLAYIFYFYHRNIQKAFWTTALIHGMYNGGLWLCLHYK